MFKTIFTYSLTIWLFWPSPPALGAPPPQGPQLKALPQTVDIPTTVEIGESMIHLDINSYPPETWQAFHKLAPAEQVLFLDHRQRKLEGLMVRFAALTQYYRTEIKAAKKEINRSSLSLGLGLYAHPTYEETLQKSLQRLDQKLFRRAKSLAETNNWSITEVPIVIVGRRFVIDTDLSSYPPETFESFDQLTPEEQLRFLEIRDTVLKRFGQGFSKSTRAGLWMKKFFYRINHRRLDRMGLKVPPVPSPYHDEKFDAEGRLQITGANQRRTLELIDRELFHNAKILTQQDRWHLTAAVGTNAGFGLSGGKRILGFDFQFGVTFVADTKNRNYYVEAFFDQSKISNVFVFAAEIAANVRFYAGPGYGTDPLTEPLMRHKIRRVYPAGLVTENSPNSSYTAGHQPGIIFPPFISTPGTYQLDGGSLTLVRLGRFNGRWAWTHPFKKVGALSQKAQKVTHQILSHTPLRIQKIFRLFETLSCQKVLSR